MRPDGRVFVRLAWVLVSVSAVACGTSATDTGGGDGAASADGAGGADGASDTSSPGTDAAADGGTSDVVTPFDGTSADGTSSGEAGTGDTGASTDSSTDAIACAVDASSFEAGASDCLGDTAITAGGHDTGYSRCGTVGPVHRPQKMACPDLRMPAPAGSCTQSGAAYCMSSANCTSVMHGVCVGQGSGFCKCVGACLSDSDCATGQICQCGATSGVCVSAKCTSDSDCGAGLLCATVPSADGSSSFFACQTPQDQCLTNSDCPACANTCVSDSSGQRICSTLPHGNP